jgi:DNA repair photolyase
LKDGSETVGPGSRRTRELPARGALGYPPGRFAKHEIVPLAEEVGCLDEPGPGPCTTITMEPARTILTRNDSPDIPFDRSVNPYRGCEHGCIYCFARPSHAYLDLSPGLDFETKIFAKPDAPRLLREELSKPGYRPAVLAIGTNTDPYQPAERRLRIMRGILEVLAEFRHPVSVVTKSSGIVADVDILSSMASAGLACAYLSITTLDPELARRMEPRASTPRRRLAAIETLVAAGVPTGVLASPMIPGLNDTELERILGAAAAAGASSAGYALVRLPWEVKDLFEDWLDEHYPARKAKVLARIRAQRGGRLNDPRWGSRSRGTGPHADLLRRRFEIASRRLRLDRTRVELDTTAFRVPPRSGDQGRLF